MSVSSAVVPPESGVVLRVRGFREADLLVTFLGERSGKVVGVASHARRSRRRFGGVLEPGMVAEFECRQSAGHTLMGLTSARGLAAPPPVVQTMPGFASFGVILNLADLMTAERMAAPEKFALLRDTLSALQHKPPRAVCAHFLAHWLTVTGFALSMAVCARCGRALPAEQDTVFSVGDGGALCGSCSRARTDRMVLPAAVRHYWLALCAAATPPDHNPDSAMIPWFVRDLWQYIVQLIGRTPNSAPYWDMIWTQHPDAMHP